MENHYQVVYTGELHPDASMPEVTQKLSSIFKVPFEKLEPILTSRKPTVLKSGLPYETAEKFSAKLTQIGLKVKLAKKTSASDTHSPSDANNTEPRRSYRLNATQPTGTSVTEDSNSNPYASPKSDVSDPQTHEIILVSGWIRLANYFIDYIAQIVLGGIIGGILGALFGYQAVIMLSDLLNKALFSLAIFFLYYMILEGTAGRTLGKLITGTKVVNISGEKPSLGQIIGRTLTRFIPFEFVTFFGSETHGLHDRWASTYVVKTRGIE